MPFIVEFWDFTSYMKVLNNVHHCRSASYMEKLISGSCWIGPGLDCDYAFPIDLYLCKSIEEVVMQSEAGSVWQDLWIRSSGCRPSKFIAVSFICVLWHIKLKKGKSEAVLPFFRKFWTCYVYIVAIRKSWIYFFIFQNPHTSELSSGILIVGTFSEIFIFHWPALSDSEARFGSLFFCV